MKILYITNKPIFPILDGGCKAMNQFLKCLLSNEFEIEHICFSTHKHPFELKNYPDTILKRVPTVSFPVETRIKLKEALKQLFKTESYVVSRFDSPNIHRQLELILKEGKFTHVILESLFTCPYINTIRENSNAKIVVRTHNVEHMIWEQYAADSKNPFKKWYLKKLSRELKSFELKTLNKADLIASISERDKEDFLKDKIESPICTIPVAIEQNKILKNYSIQKLFFLGSMNWKPNIEAVQWLTTEIFPAIRINFPKVELHLAGSFMNDIFRTDFEAGIINHGFVESSSDFMLNHGIMVLPIISGSGVRIKLLEALSLGIPVVSSPEGALGINDLNVVALANSKDEFVQKVGDLLGSAEQRSFFGQKGYHYVEENYSPDKISKLICEQLQKL